MSPSTVFNNQHKLGLDHSHMHLLHFSLACAVCMLQPLLASAGRTTGVDGCIAPFRVVPNLMGAVAIACAECLSTLHGRHSCKEECGALPRGSEFFVPPLRKDVVTACQAGELCRDSPEMPSDSQCCGLNLGMNYNLPPDESAFGTGNFLPFDRYGVLANFRRTCDYPESSTRSQACLLWRKIRGGYYQGPLTSLPCTQGEQCYQTQDGKHTLLATSANDPAHYLLMPGSKAADWPVIGIEDRQVLSPALERIWDLAWLLAFKPYQQLPFLPFGSEADLPVSVTSCNIGIALDPASSRSQHQLHLHIARIPSTLRRLFVGRFDNYATWTKLRVPITRKLESEWPIAYARYFDLSAASHGDLGGLDNAGIDPFTTTSNSGTVRNGSPRMGGPGRYGIFHQAFSFANFDPLYMQAWGLLLIPDEEPIDLRDEHARLPRGFYLVLSTNNILGTWNPFQNTTETQNEFFAPELLLCSSYSAGNGQFWTQEECYGQAPKAVRFAVQNGTDSHFSDHLIAQQRSQDAL